LSFVEKTRRNRLRAGLIHSKSDEQSVQEGDPDD
jgi:hypothetical protein